MLAITGPSGSGKSTLLHLVGTLDKPSSGTIEINGKDPFVLSEPELARFRNRVVGFVFQDHHLLPQFSVLENVLIPTLAFKEAKTAAEKHQERARELLEKVGLSHRLEHPAGRTFRGRAPAGGHRPGIDQYTQPAFVR